jgi:hypothetical protein
MMVQFSGIDQMPQKRRKERGTTQNEAEGKLVHIIDINKTTYF